MWHHALPFNLGSDDQLGSLCLTVCGAVPCPLIWVSSGLHVCTVCGTVPCSLIWVLMLELRSPCLLFNLGSDNQLRSSCLHRVWRRALLFNLGQLRSCAFTANTFRQRSLPHPLRPSCFWCRGTPCSVDVQQFSHRSLVEGQQGRSEQLCPRLW